MVSRGVIYMAGSAFAFSVMSVLVKVATTRLDLPVGDVVVVRAIVTLALSYVMVRRADLVPWGRQRGRLVIRGLLGFGGLTGYYIAIARLPLADATTIQNTTPLLTAVLAWWLLREKIGWPTAFALGCGIVGVTLLVHPTGIALDPIGIAAAICASICSATAYVTVRQLVRTEHPLVIIFYFPLVATPLALPWAIASWVMPSPVGWLMLIAIGVATQVAQVLLTKGLAIERAGRATSIGYIQVVFAMIWQLVVFGDPPTVWTMTGAAVILAGTLAVARAKDR